MTKVLLCAHVLAVILAIGPVAVAASMFPAVTRRVLAATEPAARGRDQAASGREQALSGRDRAVSGRDQAVSGREEALSGRDQAVNGREQTSDIAVLRALHRICRVYAAVGMAVPVFGVATGASLGVLDNAWLIASAVLTAVAAVLLAVVILPSQAETLDAATADAQALDAKLPARLAMTTGMFNLLWATVTVLMIVRPGSTTGA